MAQKKKDKPSTEGYEDWGVYMEAKKSKLENQFRQEALVDFKDSSSLFHGIAIFVNGYTNPPADELRRLMMAHGGIYHHYLRPGITTHMIASNLPYTKIVMYKKAQNPLPLCKPEWITDSIQTGKLLDFRKYLLYSQSTKTQPQLANIFQKVEQRKSSDKENHSTHSITTEKGSITSPAKEKSVSMCTKNSEFLTEFYNNSRLHHISTMGAIFKDYINDLRSKSSGKFDGLERLCMLYKFTKAGPSTKEDSDSEDEMCYVDTRAKLENIIMHIDMDCFFVSVGLRNRPELKGLPVAVAHAKGNKVPISGNQTEEEYGSMSEIASCSYEARRSGVKNGMFLGDALKLCPNLKTIKYDFEGYKEVSYALYDTIASYTLDIEAVSCDEMYVDCSKILAKACCTPMEFAHVLRKEIKEKTGCPVSTGFGENKLRARLATKKAKPDGQFYLKEEELLSYIGMLPVRDLPGVGSSTAHKLKQMNVITCADLQKISLSNLQKEFGKKTGDLLHNMCRGIDNSKINLEHVRKSVSAEVNYGIRFDTSQDAVTFLEKLSEEVCSRLQKANAKGRCITLKLMVRAKEAPKETAKFMGHGLCYYFTRSKNLIASIDDVSIIKKEVLSLWHQLQQVPEDIRGIGIQISRLEQVKNKNSNNANLFNFINKIKDLSKEEFQLHAIESACYNSNSEELHVIDNKTQPVTSTVNKLGTDLSLNGDTDALESPNVEKTKLENIITNLPDNLSLKASSECNEGRSQQVEIKSVSKKLVSSKGSSKIIQMKQEAYFKETKVTTYNKSETVKMPVLQEIDMSVLVELPEDIRNEILDEYKAMKRERNKGTEVIHVKENDKETKSTNIKSTINKHLEIRSKDKIDEQDLSFSQVDPEFLAALPEEMRNDVKMYCDMSKKEKMLNKEKTERVESNTNVWDKFKREKKNTVKNSKTKNGGVKNKINKFMTTKSSTNYSENVNLPTSKKQIDNSSKTHYSSPLAGENLEVILCKTSAKNVDIESEVITFDNKRFSIDDLKVREHKDILTTLVNCLLDLPVNQIKMQIQTWISDSDNVNEIDILSFSTFLGMLPSRKRIEDLHVLLKAMHRCVTKSGNCVWHETYKKIAGHIQHYMQLEYNSDLMIPPIGCNRCVR